MFFSISGYRLSKVNYYLLLFTKQQQVNLVKPVTILFHYLTFQGTKIAKFNDQNSTDFEKCLKLIIKHEKITAEQFDVIYVLGMVNKFESHFIKYSFGFKIRDFRIRRPAQLDYERV